MAALPMPLEELQEEMVDAERAGQILGLDGKTVLKYARLGLLPSYSYPPNAVRSRAVRFAVVDLLEFKRKARR